MVAPSVERELTATVLHNGFPVTVVRLTPPPVAVRVPVSVVPPETEAVKATGMVEEPEEFKVVLLGNPKLADGPPVFTVNVLATADPVPAIPSAFVTLVGSRVTPRLWPFVQLPPVKVAVATVLPLLIATEETVGAVEQVPPIVNADVEIVLMT